MTRSIIWTAVTCVSHIFNIIIYPWPIDGLTCSGLDGGGSLMSWMKVVKYCICKFLGNHKVLIYHNNFTINRKALSDFPLLSNVRWGELFCFEKSCLKNPLLALFTDSNVINLLLGGVSEEVQLMVASETVQTVSVVASIFSTSCKDSEGGGLHNSMIEDIDDWEALGGFLDTASAALCHLLGQYGIVKLYWRVFSFNFKICGFIIVHKSLLLNIDSKGLWSVITIKFWQPRTNILALFRPMQWLELLTL